MSPERGGTKRSAEPFEAALRALEVDPSEAAYVGDHPTVDVAVPTDLGMETIRVRQGRYAGVSSILPPDFEIESIAELATVLE